MPAKAGIHPRTAPRVENWTPACAGVTVWGARPRHLPTVRAVGQAAKPPRLGCGLPGAIHTCSMSNPFFILLPKGKEVLRRAQDERLRVRSPRLVDSP